MNSSLTCPLVPSEKPLEEEPMDESIPKVCVPWEFLWVKRGRVGKRHSSGVAEKKLGWVDPLMPLSPQSVTHLVCCATAPGVSCRGNICQPHSRGAQPGDSSSLEFIQHMYSPKAMCCAGVQEYGGVWDILACHRTCTPSSRGNVCFLNESKPWKSTGVFIQFCIWALMTLHVETCNLGNYQVTESHL